MKKLCFLAHRSPSREVLPRRSNDTAMALLRCVHRSTEEVHCGCTQAELCSTGSRSQVWGPPLLPHLAGVWADHAVSWVGAGREGATLPCFEAAEALAFGLFLPEGV